MGTSYQTLLVVAGIDEVSAAVATVGPECLLVPAGPDRTAVLPEEDDFGFADAASLAERLGVEFGFPVLSQSLLDSQVLFMDALRDGSPVHKYVSDVGTLIETDADGRGNLVYRLGDLVFDSVDQVPTGPLGADPAAIAPFGVGRVDRGVLGAALRGDGTPDAEALHRSVLSALNLDPTGLTMTFHRAVEAGPAGAVHLPGHLSGGTGPARREHGWRTIPLHVDVALPAGADPIDAAQVLADAVVGRSVPMRATAGYTPIVPRTAAAPDAMVTAPAPAAGQLTVTYFVGLHVLVTGEPPGADEVLADARAAWAAAWREAYGIGAGQAPRPSPLTPELFEVGLRAAHGTRSSRETGSSRPQGGVG